MPTLTRRLRSVGPRLPWYGLAVGLSVLALVLVVLLRPLIEPSVFFLFLAAVTGRTLPGDAARHLRRRRGHRMRTSASIGIALGAKERPRELVRAADEASYRAKRLGKARSVVFSPDSATGGVP